MMLLHLNTVDEFDISRIRAWRPDACWKEGYFSGKVNYVL